MTQQREQWEAWLESIPEEQQDVLFDVLKGFINPPSETKSITIRKTPVEDLFVKDPPPYLDAFHLHDIYRMLAFKSNVMVKGPKGDGKSLSVITYAHLTNTPIIIQECSEDVKKWDLMGSQMLVGDETIYTLGCIPAAIETANEYGSCILLLEELSALTPQVQKMLNAVTDFRKQCSMPFLGKTYKLNPGKYLWVVGTLNPSVYGGTYDLNEDLKSRFEEIDLTYPQAGVEKSIVNVACKHLVGTRMPESFKVADSGDLWYIDETVIGLVIKLANETRQNATGYALSTRDVVRIIETAAFLGMRRAMQLVLCKFEGDEDKNTMKMRISSIFGNGLRIENFWS